MARLDQSFIKAYGHDPYAASHAEPAAPAVESLSAGGGGMFTWTVASSTLDIAAPTGPVGPATHYPRPTPAAAPVFTPNYAPAAAPAPSAPIVIPITQPSRNQTMHRIDAGRPMQPQAAPPVAPRAPAPIVTGAVNTPVHVAVKAPAPVPVQAPAPTPAMHAAAVDPYCNRSCTIECSTHDTATISATPAAPNHMSAPQHVAQHVSHQPIAPSAPVSHTSPAPAWAQRPWQEPAAQVVQAVTADDQPYQPITAAAEMELIAGFEVDGFRWPETVRSFSERSAAALSPLVDELVNSAAAGRNVVMLAGGRRGAGASMLALYAARRAAELGLSVAIVDADFGKPSLARNLGVAPAQGWEDVLAGRCELAQCLIASMNDRVTLLPLRGSCSDLAMQCAGGMAAHLATLRRHFNLVIVDGGPLADGAEPWLQAAGDGAIDFGIVIRDVRHDAGHGGPHGGGTMRPNAHYPAIGVVENFVRLQEQS